MKRALGLLLGAAVMGLVGTAQAAGIVINQPVGALTNYFPIDFNVSCGGGEYTVDWYVDSNLIGSAKFYDDIAVKQHEKAGSGRHTFTVVTSCAGSATTTFTLP
jgi:hypothetical protein